MDQSDLCMSLVISTTLLISLTMISQSSSHSSCPSGPQSSWSCGSAGSPSWCGSGTWKWMNRKNKHDQSLRSGHMIFVIHFENYLQANVKTTRINPVTKHPEPFLSSWDKAGRLVFTNSFVVFLVRSTICMCLVLHFYCAAACCVCSSFVHHPVQNDAPEMGLPVRNSSS